MRTTEEINELCKQALQEYLETPEKERSLTKLGKKYEVSRQTLADRFKKWGHEVINQQNRKRINETVFDIIDTETKAYWLGFMYADGNISKNGHKLEMNLAVKDYDHMKKFQEFLEYTEDVVRVRYQHNRDTKQVRFSVRNKHIWEALNNKGCVPCKSLILKFLGKSIFKEEKLIYDFIRGYVDGDGCLTIHLNQKRTSMRTILEIVGTEEFLEGVVEYLQIDGCIRNKSCSNYNNKAFQLLFSDVPSRRIARLLYEHATVYLDRKYEKFLEFCRIEEESSKRKSSKIGKLCDENPELNSEIAQGSESV